MDLAARNKMLEAENDDLRFQVEQLREAMGLTLQPPVLFGLTQSENRLLGVLVAREHAPKAALHIALTEGYRSDDEEPAVKIVDVMICKIRKKLAPYFITIETDWGTGYHMTEQSKAIVRSYAAKEAA